MGPSVEEDIEKIAETEDNFDAEKIKKVLLNY